MTRARGDGDGIGASLQGVDSLWPVGSRRLTRRPGRAPALLVLPSRRSPRLLVPTGVAGAADMFARHSTSRRQRLAQAVLSRGVRSGLLPLLPVLRIAPRSGRRDAPAIEDYVREHVPGAGSVGVLLGPPRANAKPVLRVFDDRGRTLAYGKVGHNPLAASLVRRESEALQELDDCSFLHLELPRVLHAGQWRGLEVLLLSALGTTGRARPSWELPLQAMYELAEHAELESLSAGGSSYLSGLQERATGPDRNDGLAALVADVARRTSQTRLTFGRWHGDWAPWNMGSSSPRVQLWDWERSETGVPMGFDIAHFVLQTQFRKGATPAAATAALLHDAGAALARWYSSREQTEATLLLYLTEILHRYVGDGGANPSAALRSRVSTITSIISLITKDLPKEQHVDA